MKNRVKERAKAIFGADQKNIIIAGAIYAVLSLVVTSIGGNIISDTVSSLLNSALTASMACFYFRAYNRGKSDFTDMYILFTEKEQVSKMATIVLALCIFWLVIDLITTLLMFIPLLNLVSIIALLFAGLLLALIWYLYIANHTYPTEYYFKGSAKYISGHIFEYIFFCFGLVLLEAILQVFISMIAGNWIATILVSPIRALVQLTMAGYVANIIPDEWYAGTATF